MSDYFGYLVFFLVVSYYIKSQMRFVSVRKKLPEYLNGGAVVVDLRPATDYARGHFEGSINIPFTEMRTKIGELDPNATLVLCCATGSRSTRAAAILEKNGFKKVVVAGPIRNLAHVRNTR